MKYTVLIVFVNAFAYFAMAALSRASEPEVYGQLVFSINIVSTVVFLVLLGRTEHELREASLKKRPINLAPFLLSTACYVLAVWLLDRFYDGLKVEFIVLALPLGLVMLASEYLSVFLRLTNRYVELAILGKPASCFYIIAAVSAVSAGFDLNVITYIAWGMLAAYGTIFAWRAMTAGSWQIDLEEILDRRSVPFWFSSMLFLFNVQAGSLILGHLGKLGAVAEYSLAMLVVTIGTVIFSAYFSVAQQATFYSTWARSQLAGLEMIVEGMLRGLSLGCALAVSGFIAIRYFYPHIFELSKYGNLEQLSLLMLPVLLVRSLSAPLGLAINLEHSIWRKNAVSLAAYTLALTVTLSSVEKYGLYGAYAGFLCGEVFLLVGFLAIFSRQSAALGTNFARLLQAAFWRWQLAAFIGLRKLGKRGKKAPHISICGYYGFSNLGDDLFVRAVYEGAKADLASGALRMTFIGAVVDGVPDQYFPAVQRMCPPLYRAVYRSDTPLGRAFRMLVKLTVVLRTDVVMFAGGSLFSDPSGGRMQLDRILHRAGIRFLGLGISVGPFANESGKQVVLDYCGIFEFVHTRDKRSIELLREANIRSLPMSDIVFSLGSVFPVVRRGGSTPPRVLYIPVSLDGDHGTQQDQLMQALHAEHDRGHYSLSIGVLQTDDLFTVTEPGLRYNGDIDSYIDQLRGFDYIVTARLHGAILAAVLGIPFYLLRHHQKCTDCMDELGWPYANRLPVSEFISTFRGLLATPPYIFEEAHVTAQSSVRSMLRMAAEAPRQAQLSVIMSATAP